MQAMTLVSLALIFSFSMAVILALRGAWQWYHRRQLSQLAQAIVDRYVPITVEVVQGQYLTYHRITQEFICQGQSYQEWAQAWLSKYPTKMAVASEEHTRLLIELQAQAAE